VNKVTICVTTARLCGCCDIQDPLFLQN